MNVTTPFGVEFDYTQLRKALAEPRSDQDLFEAIVNAPFADRLSTTLINLGIIVFLRVNKQTETIDRIALSKTELADATKNMSPKRFEDIKIPLGHDVNIIARAIATKQPQDTSDWKYLFTPELSAAEARLNQAGGAIAYSCVYPLCDSRDGGALIFSFYQQPIDIGDAHKSFMITYTDLVKEALARDLTKA